ncbi:MAG: fluoride efflux transporter CrcB [Candidatus Nitrosocaldaceae archaeon]
MQINDIVFLASGAVLGALARYIVTSKQLFIYGLPIGVLTVNVIGSIILGMFMTIFQLYGLDRRYLLFVAIGFCGSLTTMSSFAYEVANMIENKQFIYFFLDIALNVGLSILGIFIGRIIVLTIVK